MYGYPASQTPMNYNGAIGGDYHNQVYNQAATLSNAAPVVQSNAQGVYPAPYPGAVASNAYQQAPTAPSAASVGAAPSAPQGTAMYYEQPAYGTVQYDAAGYPIANSVKQPVHGTPTSAWSQTTQASFPQNTTMNAQQAAAAVYTPPQQSPQQAHHAVAAPQMNAAAYASFQPQQQQAYAAHQQQQQQYAQQQQQYAQQQQQQQNARAPITANGQVFHWSVQHNQYLPVANAQPMTANVQQHHVYAHANNTQQQQAPVFVAAAAAAAAQQQQQYPAGAYVHSASATNIYANPNATAAVSIGAANGQRFAQHHQVANGVSISVNSGVNVNTHNSNTVNGANWANQPHYAAQGQQMHNQQQYYANQAAHSAYQQQQHAGIHFR